MPVLDELLELVMRGERAGARLTGAALRAAERDKFIEFAERNHWGNPAEIQALRDLPPDRITSIISDFRSRFIHNNVGDITDPVLFDNAVNHELQEATRAAMPPPAAGTAAPGSPPPHPATTPVTPPVTPPVVPPVGWGRWAANKIGSGIRGGYRFLRGIGQAARDTKGLARPTLGPMETAGRKLGNVLHYIVHPLQTFRKIKKAVYEVIGTALGVTAVYGAYDYSQNRSATQTGDDILGWGNFFKDKAVSAYNAVAGSASWFRSAVAGIGGFLAVMGHAPADAAAAEAGLPPTSTAPANQPGQPPANGTTPAKPPAAPAAAPPAGETPAPAKPQTVQRPYGAVTPAARPAADAKDVDTPDNRATNPTATTNVGEPPPGFDTYQGKPLDGLPGDDKPYAPGEKDDPQTAALNQQELDRVTHNAGGPIPAKGQMTRPGNYRQQITVGMSPSPPPASMPTAAPGNNNRPDFFNPLKASAPPTPTISPDQKAAYGDKIDWSKPEVRELANKRAAAGMNIDNTHG